MYVRVDLSDHEKSSKSVKSSEFVLYRYRYRKSVLPRGGSGKSTVPTSAYSTACHNLTFQAPKKRQVMAGSSSYCRLRQVVGGSSSYDRQVIAGGTV